VVQDDPKTVWTVEEDLRLLDAIGTCGLGNWADIARRPSVDRGPRQRLPNDVWNGTLTTFWVVLATFFLPTQSVEDEDEQDVGEDERQTGEGESEPKKRRIERMTFFRSRRVDQWTKRQEA
jgi:hypothetical protein